MSCKLDSDCPFLFSCSSEHQCQHDPIFPLQLYPCVIYLLFPIAVGIVNMAGNCLGIFKVLLMMNLLRYDIASSTALVQPMVAGAALPNFFNIAAQKHPHLKTTLVDYNIIAILLPCCLLGSTFGAIIEQFIPQIFQDLLVVIFFSYFTMQFIKKLKQLKQPIFENVETMNSENKVSLITENGEIKEAESPILSPQEESRKSVIEKKENSLHLQDIGMTMLVFVVFQFFVFLLQGKLPFYHFKACSWEYFCGLLFLCVMVAIYLYWIRFKMNQQFTQYNNLHIPYNLDLSEKKIFNMIALGGLSAGIIQGILGAGSGTFLMGIFYSFNLNPRVASATSGYQVFFIGAASFIQAFITNAVILKEAMFLFWWCAIAGGAVTIAFYAYLKKKEQKIVSKLLVTLIAVLCVISVIGVFPSTYGTWKEFGWDYLISIKFHC